MRNWRFFGLAAFVLIVFASGCQQQESQQGDFTKDLTAVSEIKNKVPEKLASTEARLVTYTEKREPCTNYNPQRMALFGDLHVHTKLSFDAVAGRVNTTPTDAHDFAMGKPIAFFPQGDDGKPSGSVTIDRPLDFLAVTDHSEFLGERELCTNPSSPQYDGEFCQVYREIEFRGTLMLATVLNEQSPKRIAMLCGEDGELCVEYSKGPWKTIIEAAEQAYDRSSECSFTSFIGYEYTGTPGLSNYHRNVIFRNGTVPALPTSFIEAPYDYQLWRDLENSCAAESGCQFMTIPHNTTMSNGKLLTPYADLERTPENKLRYATTRNRVEPLIEIFQHKGASECINGLDSVLGAADELCDIEQVRVMGAVTKVRNFVLDGTSIVREQEEEFTTVECEDETGSTGMFAGGCVSRNDFFRSALLTGMQEEQVLGVNPVKMGVVASTDGHTGVPGAVKEDEWLGFVSGEMTTDKRLQAGTLPSGIKGNPGGLAGVWAVENSRDAIFEAMQRREVFGTSGPRITPRFFAGWNYNQDLCSSSALIETAYETGVPMGGDLPTAPHSESKPVFILAASRDPAESAASLQQLQMIKGWIDDNGESHTRVTTVAGTPDNKAGFNPETDELFGEGHSMLCTVYTDPDFNPNHSAYYYLRAVENPTPRWSYYDCKTIPEPDRPEVCTDKSLWEIQEMAWSSPIWYTPAD